MKAFTLLCVSLSLAAAGCGGESSDDASDGKRSNAAASTSMAPASVVSAGTGKTITSRNSEFGRMLFDVRKQAIYIFENDRPNKTVCYGRCAEAWPPVLTRGAPKAQNGVRRSLLGTIRRRDGKRQVTYAGKPLYYYAHEGPGEVRCHNIDLNGGLWWVIGPNGKRRP